MEFPPPFLPINSSSTNGVGGNVALIGSTSIDVGGINTGGTTRSGNISLTANEINLTGGANSVIGAGSNILLQPFATSQAITIGGVEDNGTQILDLTATELDALADGFSSITFGRANSSGAIIVDGAGIVFAEPIIFRSPETGGAIVINGAIQTNANTLTLMAGDSIDINADITTTGGAIDISSGGTIDTTGSFLRSRSTSEPGGAITLQAVGNITTGGQLIAYGTSRGGDIRIRSTDGNINISDVLAAGAVVVDSQGNTLFITDEGGSITIEGGGDITAREMFSVGEVSDGDVSIVSNSGSINIAGAIGAPEVIDGTGGDVTISASGNVITGDISSSGSLGGGNIDLISSGGSIDTQAGSLDASSSTADGGIISLSAVGNITTGDVSSRELAVEGVEINVSDVTTAGDQIYLGTTTFNSDYVTGGGNFTVIGDATLASHETLVNTSGGNIRFAGTIDGTVERINALSLAAGAGDIMFEGDVGSRVPLGAITVTSAGDLSIGGRFVGGDTNVIYSGLMTTPGDSLDVASLFLDENASGARLFGAVAGKVGRDAALEVKGPSGDLTFTINGFVIGTLEEPRLPAPAEITSSVDKEVQAAAEESAPVVVKPPMLVHFESRRSPLSADPTASQFSNCCGNEELWGPRKRKKLDTRAAP